MSRIRGIEVKVQKEVLQTRKYGLNEILKKKDEDQSSNPKDDAEKLQMRELLVKLPKLGKIFEVHRKIGEGTFSSVYLGSLRQHGALPVAERRWFAIKHLVPTAHPARVEHELRCLQDMGGKDHVIGVELCLRHLDTIVFIMPYLPHRKFSEYVGEMDAEELRRYMRALMVALRHVHSFHVIHRDVKPSNFLYDRENGRYLLVDFGLAQRLCPPPAPRAAPPALPAAPPALPAEPAPPPAVPAPPPAHSANTRKRPHEQDSSPPAAKRAALDLRVGPRHGASHTHDISKHKSAANRTPGGVGGGAAGGVGGGAAGGVGGGAAGGVGGGAGGGRGGECACAGRGAVCARCGLRPAPRAPRAGTQGFRPPEVLLKCAAQGTGVDMWASGVVLASVLTARYPLLRAADDGAALAELADLLGTAPLQRAAAALGRRVVTSSVRRGLCLRKLTARLRGGASGGAASGDERAPSCDGCRLPSVQCLCRDDTKKAEDIEEGASTAGFPDSAFALASRLLDPDPRSRITASQALLHPFLAP